MLNRSRKSGRTRWLCRKVAPRRFALYAAHRIQRAGRGQGALAGSDVLGRPREHAPVALVLCIARASQQHVPLVPQLAGNDAPRQHQGEVTVLAGVVLGTAQQYVARSGPFQARLEAAVRIKQHQCNAVVRQPVHQRHADAHRPETDDRAQVVQWHPQPGLVTHQQPQGVVVQPQVAVGQRHVQGIEQLHAQAPSWGLNKSSVVSLPAARRAKAAGWHRSRSEQPRQRRSSEVGGGKRPAANIARTSTVVSVTC